MLEPDDGTFPGGRERLPVVGAVLVVEIVQHESAIAGQESTDEPVISAFFGFELLVVIARHLGQDAGLAVCESQGAGRDLVDPLRPVLAIQIGHSSVNPFLDYFLTEAAGFQ